MKTLRPPALTSGAASVAAAAASHVWGDPVADAAVPFDPAPHSHVRHGGAHHPVNGHWHAANTAPWPHLAARTRQELYVIQTELLHASNGRELTPDELAYLNAANNHFNVRTSIDWLGGRDHREFGFEGLDQVHGTWKRLRCGCRLRWVLDHHKAVSSQPYESHPHHPLPVCAAHAPLLHDVELLHARAEADDQAAAAAAARG